MLNATIGKSLALAAVISAGTLLATVGSADAATKIKFCTSAGMNSAIQPVIYAQNKKYYEKYGVEIERLDLDNDATTIQALIAKACDMVYAGAGTGIVAIAAGADIKIVSSHTPWTDYVLVGQPEIKSIKDLVGKTMGTSALNSLNYQAATYALTSNGIQLAQVQFIASGGSDAIRGQALAAKKIDGAVMNGTFATQAMKADPTLHVVFDVGSSFRDKFLSTAVFSSGALIKDHPEVVLGVVKALIDASRDLMSDEKLAISQAVSTGLPEDVMQKVYDNIFSANAPYYGVDGGIDKAKVTSTIALLKEGGSLTVDTTYEKVVNPTFVDQAMKDLGPWKKS